MKMEKIKLISVSSLLLALSIVISAAEFSTEDCASLGFIKANLLCSSCDQLNDFSLESLVAHCKECCHNDESTRTEKNTDQVPFCGPKAAKGQGCPRCGFPVYAAEQMHSKNGTWHKRCFSCAECHRSLDSTNLNDGPDCEIYCRGCYGRNFGPKGVGFGMGAGTLTMA